MRPQHVAKRLVFVVWEVDLASRFILEGKEETVGEAVVVPFRTVVDAPPEIGNGVDLGRQRAKCVYNLLDIFFAGCFVKSEEHSVSQHSVACFCF